MCNILTPDAVSSHQPPPAPRHGRLSTQVYACVAASFGSMATGIVNAWTAGSLPSLNQDPSLGHMGPLQNSMTVSIIAAGCLAGSCVSGRVMDALGRRTTILATYPLLMAGWLTIALAHSLLLVLVGRFLCGLATSVFFSAPSVYSSEVPKPCLRGRLGIISSFFITLGVMYTTTVGVLVPWRTSCYICAAPSLLGAVLLLLAPESPYWLLLKGRRKEAKAALHWLWGPDQDVEAALDVMDEKIKSVGVMRYRELLKPRTRRPFGIAVFLMAVQQLCGGNILMMYTGNIFLAAGMENIVWATISTGMLQMVGVVVSILLMDRLGRRSLIITSTAIIGPFMLLLGVYYYLRLQMGVAWPIWVPVVLVMVVVFAYCLGCRSVPWLASAELFNTTIRSTANTVCIFINRCIHILVVLIYPFFEEAAGPYSAFFTFGVLCLLFSVLCFFIVPETKGKSLEQIQEYFERVTPSKDSKTAANSLGPEAPTTVKLTLPATPAGGDRTTV